MSDPAPFAAALSGGGTRAGRGRRLATVLAGLGLLLGIWVRVAFLGRKPFWRDEAWVAWLVELPSSSLRAYNYVVPVGFMAAVRAIGGLFSGLPPEIAYRLLPLAVGLAALGLLPLLARRLGGSPPVAMATLWLATGLPAFVYYSRELKPHGTDLLLAVLLPLLVLLTEAEGHRQRVAGWALLLVTMSIAPWFTFGGLFMVAATLVLAGARRLWRHSLAAWSAAAIAVVLAAAAVYRLAWRRQLNDVFLRQLWSDDLRLLSSLPLVLRPLRAFVDLHASALTYLFPHVWPVALILIALGTVVWPRRHRVTVVSLWLAPAALASLAAAVGLYPTSQGRLLLFVAPPLVLLAAAGLVAAGGWVRDGSGQWASVGVAMAASVWWSGQAFVHRRSSATPDSRLYFLYDVIHDVQPLIRRLDWERPAATAVMVSRFAADPFRYYSRGRYPRAYVCGLLDNDFAAALERWRLSWRDRGFVLVVEEDVAGGRREALNDHGFVVDEVAVARGARLWRLTPRSPPAGPPPRRGRR